MRAIGPSVHIKTLYLSKRPDGGKILIVKCARPIFREYVPVPQENPTKKRFSLVKAVVKRKPIVKKKAVAKKQSTLKDKITRLEGVLFFMYRSDSVTADDYTVIIRLRSWADSHEVEGAIRRVIASHHGWMTSRPDPTSEEDFWRGAPSG